MSPGPVWICNRFTSLWEPTHIQTAVCACVLERECVCVCVHICPMCLSVQVWGECRTRIEHFCKQYAYLSLSCSHHNRQGHSKGELGTVVTVYAMGFGVLTLNCFFDKGMCRRREASAVERTPSPSVASQADSLLTVQRLITGHGK